jgi:hypothetical protein
MMSSTASPWICSTSPAAVYTVWDVSSLTLQKPPYVHAAPGREVSSGTAEGGKSRGTTEKGPFGIRSPT